MKKLLITFVALFSLNYIVAQTPANVGGIKPPKEVTDNFTKHHPSETANWSKEGDNYKATFEDPNSHKGVLIVYDKKGDVIRTENEMDNTAYPVSINEYYTKNYPDEKYKLYNTQDKTGTNGYYINRENNEMIWFDKDGNFIKKTTR